MKVASVFLPDIGHLTKRRIVEKCVLRACLLRNTLTRVLQLLAFVTVSDNLLLFAIEGVGKDSRFERTLHGDFL